MGERGLPAHPQKSKEKQDRRKRPSLKRMIFFCATPTVYTNNTLCQISQRILRQEFGEIFHNIGNARTVGGCPSSFVIEL